MNTYHIEVKLCTGTDWCTALKPIEITAEHKEDVYKKILDGFNALEKQIPKKPLHQGYIYACPCCNNEITIGSTFLRPNQNYCTECGQKLDWTE